MAAQSRIELILDLKNRIGVGLNNARSQINKEVGGMQSKLAQLSSSMSRGISDVGSQLPMIGGGLSALINPMSLTAAGITAIGVGFVKATDAAADFNNNFRNLANLNLDRTRSDLKNLRDLMLDTAWSKGFNAKETTQAYNDIQSTIGLYGSAARPIVETQGEFAKVMQADMNEYVAGTAKAMANWRFGVDRLDAFNKSAYAAMQVGVVSFEELSRVQSVYAGAAASINQDFDTANKLFSLFTIKTKSVDQAATLTKSLFNDLTKKTTIAAFKKIGVNFYDMNGQLKQADQIMLELNQKFMQMKDDRSIIALKNQFVGSDGLISMIQAATDTTGQLKTTFDEFTNSKFNFENAKENALNDIVYRQEQLTNRINNLMIRLGQVLMPMKESLVGMAEVAVSRINWQAKSYDEKKQGILESEKASVYSTYGDMLTNVQNMTEAQFNSSIALLQKKSKEYNDAFDKKTADLASTGFFNTPFISHFRGHEDKMQRLDDRNNYDRQYDLARSKAFNTFAKDLQDKWYNRNSLSNPVTANANGTDKGTSTTPLNDALTKVVDSAKTPRNITVNIDSFNKGGINTQNTSLGKMDADQIEEWFIDLGMRVIRNIETSY